MRERESTLLLLLIIIMADAMQSSTILCAEQIEAMTKTLHDKLHLNASSSLSSCAALAPPRCKAILKATAASAIVNDDDEEELHMVMVPYPLQGHINPMVQFAKVLIAKYPNVCVTFVNNKHNHERIQQTRSKASKSALGADVHESSSITNINIPPVHSMSHDPPKNSTSTHMSAHELDQLCEEKLQFLWVENGLPPDFDYTDIVRRIMDFHLSTYNMKEPLKQLLQKLNKKGPLVSCILFGSFCPWVHTVSIELGIPSVFFWTQSASVFSMYYHAPLLAANGFFPYNKKKTLSGICNEDDGGKSQETITELVSYVPGVPPLHPSSFPTLMHIDGILDPSFASIMEQLTILKDCQGVIINSFEELEKDAYQALQAELPIPVSLVGPLIPLAFLEEGESSDTSVGASLLQERRECIDWLNSQKKHSVLYVSFGSLFAPHAEDLQSIACGIKASKQPFLWVIRPTSSLANVADILPKGFIDDTKDYGLIIPWAPQLQVLSHHSVGAFLTHCGWNSTLESVSMGVPMIAFPGFSDQPTNCVYVCDVWKVGMPLKRQDDGKVRSNDVERVVRTALQEEEGEEMRRRLHKLKEAARRAMRSQLGSSSVHIEKFIHSMRSLKSARKVLT